MTLFSENDLNLKEQSDEEYSDMDQLVKIDQLILERLVDPLAEFLEHKLRLCSFDVSRWLLVPFAAGYFQAALITPDNTIRPSWLLGGGCALVLSYLRLQSVDRAQAATKKGFSNPERDSFPLLLNRWYALIVVIIFSPFIDMFVVVMVPNMYLIHVYLSAHNPPPPKQETRELRTSFA